MKQKISGSSMLEELAIAEQMDKEFPPLPLQEEILPTMTNEKKNDKFLSIMDMDFVDWT